MATTSKNNTSVTKVVIPCRISFANIFEAKSINGGDAKFSVSCLIPKTDKKTLLAIHKAVEAAKEDGKTRKWGGKIPGNCKTPLRDGDTEREDDENYAGHYFLNANASEKSRPAVKVADGGELFDAMDSEEFYSGCYGVAVLNFYPYDASGNKGVAAGLNIVMKTKDGEKLSGSVNVETALGDMLDF